MKYKHLISIVVTLISVAFVSCQAQTTKTKQETEATQPSVNLPNIFKTMKFLNPEEKAIIVNKHTERPFTGIYEKSTKKGTYLCKQCQAPLFLSDDKFDAGCGWPSFDQAIPGAVIQKPDADGIRTEILCANCGAHLGHVFKGEGFTPKNTRNCVNSLSLDFTTETPEVLQSYETAVFAGGCFWGVEHLMSQAKGVKSVTSGYTGGTKAYPTYEEVCSHTTGHVEAVEIRFDPKLTNYETLAKLFFEIHDPEQANGQGPDIGPQYLSEIFYLNEDQQKTALKLIDILKAKGYKVATKVRPATTFWEAEPYHQDYYDRKGTEPYCHIYTKRF